MNDPDLKRLITGFLVLATAASSSVLMFSGFVSSEPTQAPALQVQTSTPYPVVGQNAFVETLSEAVELIEKPLTSPGVEPLNLTDAVTDVIVKELAAANPSGPELANGVLGANAPTPDAFFASADALFKDPRVVSELTAETKSELPPAPSNIIRSPSPDDLVNYIDSFDKIMDSDVQRAVLDQTDSFAAVNALDLALTERIARLQRLPVPESLVPFHLATLGLFQTVNRLSQIALGGAMKSDDPVKQVLLIQAGSLRIDEAVERYKDEAVKMVGVFQGAFAAPAAIEKSSVSVLRGVLTIEKAYAISFGDIFKRVRRALQAALSVLGGPFGCVSTQAIGTIDATAEEIARIIEQAFGIITEVVSVPVSNPNFKELREIKASVGKTAIETSVVRTFTFKQCMVNALTDIVKDRLVHRIVNQTVKWIQGGGNPQFIQDWKGFLRDAGNVAAGNLLFDIEPRLCSSFGPLIKIAFQPVSLSDPPVNCTLDQVVRNVKDFQNSFSNGGWIAYGAALNPNGNFFGQLIQVNDLVLLRSAEARQAAENDARSGQGFPSTKNCVKRENRKLIECQRRVAERNRNCDPAKGCIPENPAACQIQFGNIPQEEQACVESLGTTPGAAIGATLYNALGAPIQRIVNAQDLVTLVNALINSLLNKFTTLVSRKDSQGREVRVPDERGLLGLTPTVTEDPTTLCSGLPTGDRRECLLSVCPGLPDPKPSACNSIPPPVCIPPDTIVNGVCTPPITPPNGNCPTNCQCTGTSRPLGSFLPFTLTGLLEQAQDQVEALPCAESGLKCDDKSVVDGDANIDKYVQAVAAAIKAIDGGKDAIQGSTANPPGPDDEAWIKVSGGDRSEHFDIVRSDGPVRRGAGAETSICQDPAAF